MRREQDLTLRVEIARQDGSRDAMPNSKQATLKAIKLLFAPRSIAFIGASSDPTKQSGQPVRNVAAAGFQGSLYAVNRRREVIDAIPTYGTIEELPTSIETAFVTVPAEQCASTVERLGSKGVKFAVLAVGGFAETGSSAGQRTTE